jgi:hypothetical protein
MAIVKATFLLPVKDNDGRNLLAEIHETQDSVWNRFKAFTHEGEVTGAYLMADGRQATDLHKKYTLLLDESQLGALVELLRGFKAKTTQEAIYLEILHAVEVRMI